MRELWVQVSVEMPTDDKLYSRSLLERHLWTCLLCLAKKQGPEGSIRGYTPALLEKHFNIGSVGKVILALDYFAKVKMVELRANGDILLLHFAARQAMSRNQLHAARQARYRDANSDANGVTHGDAESDAPDVTSDGEESKRVRGRSPLTPANGGIESDAESDEQRQKPRLTRAARAKLEKQIADERRAKEREEQRNKLNELAAIRPAAPPAEIAGFIAKALGEKP